jgi:biopolymer transport protein ExbB/TolQ
VPFSADNPNRNRNFVILILGGVCAFAIVMGSYVALAIAGEDTENFVRFLTILVVTLIPSALAAIRANSAAQSSEKTAEKVETVAKSVTQVEEKLNGSLDARLRQANRDTAEEDTNGRPTV